jgi:hypothetical protein
VGEVYHFTDMVRIDGRLGALGPSRTFSKGDGRPDGRITGRKEKMGGGKHDGTGSTEG